MSEAKKITKPTGHQHKVVSRPELGSTVKAGRPVDGETTLRQGTTATPTATVKDALATYGDTGSWL